MRLQGQLTYVFFMNWVMVARHDRVQPTPKIFVDNFGKISHLTIQKLHYEEIIQIIHLRRQLTCQHFYGNF